MSDKKLGCLIPLGVVVVLLIVVAICSFRAEPYAPSTAPPPNVRPTSPPWTPPWPTSVSVATAAPRPTATSSLPLNRETVSDCKPTWEYILYVAEGYEIDGHPPSTALDMAVVGVSEVYGVSVDALADCIEVLKQAGYDADRLQPRR